jgi:hypothetical protein
VNAKQHSVVRTMLLGAAFFAALAFAWLDVSGVARAQSEPSATGECGVYFGEDSCPAQIPRDAAARARVRAFCGGLKEAADAVLSGARPGFRMQSGQDMWQGEVNEHRVMWGDVRGRGIYTYDASAPDARQRYELAFFFPGVSAAELEEGLSICPAFFLSVTGTASTPILFHRRPNEGVIEMFVSAEALQYDSETRAHQSGALISFLRQGGR